MEWNESHMIPYITKVHPLLIKYSIGAIESGFNNRAV